MLATLKNIAPTLINAIVNPTSALPKAINYIADAFGITDDKKTVEHYINSDKSIDNESLIKLKAYELKFAQEETRRLEIELENVKNARDREIEFLKHGKRDFTIPVLTYLTISLLSFFIYFICTHTIPPDSKDIIVFLAGQITGFTGSIYMYFFGSSKGSADKNKFLFDEQKK